jgi:orotate phosphoribosyltransferase
MIRHKRWPGVKKLSHNAPSHTEYVFDVEKFQRLVDLFVRKLSLFRKHREFNAIAGCGNSGVPLTGALSYKLGVPLILVRKPGEQTVAAGPDVIGAIDAGPYVIVEDFKFSGGTLTRMMDAIYCQSSKHSEPAAVFMYRWRNVEWPHHRHEWYADGDRSKKPVHVRIFGMNDRDYAFVDKGDDPGQLDLFS